VTTGADLVRDGFRDACASLDRIVRDLADDEFFWEPVAGCWTVHHRAERRARSADGAGDWVIDYELPEPDPAPVTTIAWRLVHIAAVNVLYWDYAFGPASATFDLDLPGDAAAAVAWLGASQRAVRDAVTGITDADLDRPCRTNWGEVWPLHRIVGTLTTEQRHHGAEISLLRDLYRNRDTLGRAPG
jgi:DinB superfamily